MKRIPFTIEAWKAGGVPVTRSGEYVKQLTWFEGAIGRTCPIMGMVGEELYSWTVEGNYFPQPTKESVSDLLLEFPCTKYYTHYYRELISDKFYSFTDVSENPQKLESNWKFIKTVEVEL